VVFVVGSSCGDGSTPTALTYVPLTPIERRRVAALAVVVLFRGVFFVCVAQAGGSMALFADNQTNRHVAGHEFPATWFQVINPILVLLLAPLFSMLWTRINVALCFPMRRKLVSA
jgi:dipeptide/tripeptide permease